MEMNKVYAKKRNKCGEPSITWQETLREVETEADHHTWRRFPLKEAINAGKTWREINFLTLISLLPYFDVIFRSFLVIQILKNNYEDVFWYFLLVLEIVWKSIIGIILSRKQCHDEINEC